MELLMRFAYSALLYALIPTVLAVAWYRFRYHKGIIYSYPLATTLHKQGVQSTHPHKKIRFLLRFFTLLGLALLIAKPQLIDPRSMVSVEGIDIMLVLDISGSMNMPHHAGDERSRIEVAKTEAIRFIDKRTNDAIGVVVFGNDALSRCPLTVDKSILKDIVREVDIGMVNPEGTLVATSIVTAANRLKQSKAKSKVMILLTDGEPSDHDMDPQAALAVAKQLGIKIYTVGIGDDQDVWIDHPFYGRIPIKTTLNKKLLTLLAQETGGMFFEAKNATDMRKIYDTIDSLEKTNIQAPIFTNYHDIFMPFLACLIGLTVLDTLLSWVWFAL